MRRAIIIAALTLAFTMRAQDAASWWNALAADGKPDVLDGLVAWWKLDETIWNGTAGEVKDSINGNNATASGGAYVTNGLVGNCGYFNGASAYVQTTNSFQIEKTFTACGWFKRMYIAGNEGKLFWHLKSSGTYYGWQVYMLPDDKIKANVGAYQTDYVVTDAAISNEQWHFVALVSNGTTFRIYVNGFPASVEQNVGEQTFTAEPFRIGKGIGANEWFSGTIDDVRLYNRALSSNEVSTIYNRYK